MALEPYGFRHNGVIYEFCVEAQENDAQTRLTGRKTFKDVEVLNATIPGSKNQANSDLVTPDLIERKGLEEHYNRWKAGEAAQMKGQPLQNLPGLSPAQIKSLVANGFPTLETLAEMDDALLSLLGEHGRALRDKARALTGFHEDPGILAMNKRLMDDMASANAKNEALENQMAALKAQIEAMQQPKEAVKPAKEKAA